MATTQIYEMITDKIVDMLEKGVAPWRKPWVGNAAPKNLVSKKPYRGINTFLLGASPYSSPFWLTFKQAKDLKGSVKKGEKGTPVIFWKLYEKEDADVEDGKKTIPVLRYYTVFNAEQCEGIKTPPLEIREWPEHERIERAEAIQLAMPNRPTVLFGGGEAYYMPSTDTVSVPEIRRFEQREEFYSTLFHELAHSTGHASRLNREAIAEPHFFGDRVYSKEELIAEMASSFLCATCGIESATLENSAAYIQGWIKALRGDSRLAITAAAAAQKAADYILNQKEEE